MLKPDPKSKAERDMEVVARLTNRSIEEMRAVLAVTNRKYLAEANAGCIASVLACGLPVKGWTLEELKNGLYDAPLLNPCVHVQFVLVLALTCVALRLSVAIMAWAAVYVGAMYLVTCSLVHVLGGVRCSLLNKCHRICIHTTV